MEKLSEVTTADRELVITRTVNAPRELRVSRLDRAGAYRPLVGAARLYHHHA